jgi:hypothetical protein
MEVPKVSAKRDGKIKKSQRYASSWLSYRSPAPSRGIEWSGCDEQARRPTLSLSAAPDD